MPDSAAVGNNVSMDKKNTKGHGACSLNASIDPSTHAHTLFTASACIIVRLHSQTLYQPDARSVGMRSKLPERFGCSPILRTINKNAVGVLAKDPGRNKYIIEINILVDLTHTHIRAHIHT